MDEKKERELRARIAPEYDPEKRFAHYSSDIQRDGKTEKGKK